MLKYQKQNAIAYHCWSAALKSCGLSVTERATCFGSIKTPKEYYMSPMRTLISESEIKDRVRQIGAEISEDYNARTPTLVCVLKGSIIFFADLIRVITLDVNCEFAQT